MIAQPNAIVNPRAVMIKAFHATSTDAAVPATTGSDRFAVRAQLCTLHVLEHLHEVDIVIHKVAWLHE